MKKKLTTEPMLTVELGDQVSLSGEIKEPVLTDLHQRLIIENPIWTEKNRRGYWTGDTSRSLTFIGNEGGIWKMPRGFINKLIEILLSHECFFVVDNVTKLRVLPQVEFEFNGELWEHQKKASTAILYDLFGVASLPTGSGKTALALYCIAKRRQPTLVVVHTKELLYQWRDEAKQFLKLKDDDIGLIGDGKKKVGKKLTIAIINSLRKMAPEVKDKVGFLIVDECHHVPSSTFIDAVSEFDCKFMLGLSATPKRKDGLTDLIYLYLGDLVYDADTQELQEKGVIMQPKVRTRNTSFDYPYNDDRDYQPMITALVNDSERNNLITQDVYNVSLSNSGVALVVSDRKDHCAELARLIEQKGFRVSLLTSVTAKGKRKKIVDDADAGNIDVLVSTSSLIGEGFNCKILSSLFLTTPIKSSTKLEQIVGRIRRTAEGKEPPVVYDYVDINGVLRASYRTRFRTYEKIGATFI